VTTRSSPQLKIAQLVDLLRQLAEFNPSCNLHGDEAINVLLGLDGTPVEDLLTNGKRCRVARLGHVTAIGKGRELIRVMPIEESDVAVLKRFAGETILPDDVAAALAKVTGP
jgi:hypothetical protein